MVSIADIQSSMQGVVEPELESSCDQDQDSEKETRCLATPERWNSEGERTASRTPTDT